MSTFVHGIAASQNLDSSGEIISIEGMDISTLTIDGCLTWEHELGKTTNAEGKQVDISIKIPAQIVGKILKAKKIFSEKDTEDEYQLYFWNKCRTPYLYIIGELFDDYKDSAKDVAGMFRYDSDRKGQYERPMMNFSVEGGKMSKVDNLVTRSVARKVTITTAACNKAAIAEMVPPKGKKDSIDELFKTENIVEIELFKTENIPTQGASTALSGIGPTSSPGLLASEHSAPKNPDLQGQKLGRTTSGKDVFSHGRVHAYSNFSHKDHSDAARLHIVAHSYHTGNTKMQQHHAGKAKLHDQAATSIRLKNNRFQKTEDINKTLDVGSSLSSPANIVGGATLSKKSNKSDWLIRAEEEYKKWEKREQFETFMKSRLPHLTKGEIKSIGQVIALQKSLNLEQALIKVSPSAFQHSYMVKKEKKEIKK